MNDKLTIRVNIVDRFYPLKIERKDEEKIRKAAKTINDTVLQYKKVYVEKDSQDFLAMAALQFVSRMLEKESEYDLTPVIEDISNIEKQVDEILSQE